MDKAAQEVYFRKYAKLILEVGVNLNKEQNLLISAEAHHIDFITILTEEAYKLGANYVLFETEYPQLTQARVNNANPETLETLPSWFNTKFDSMISEQWARVKIFGPTDPDLLGKLDSTRLAVIQKAASIIAKPLSEACGAGIISWCVAALPTPQWAANIYNLPASHEIEQRLWQEMIHILSLDEENPSDFWRKKGQRIQQRAETLTNLNAQSFHFFGAGTDLHVHCLDNAIWVGGSIKNAQDKPFIPNLPTEECFTTPHAKKTEGTVRVNRPVEVLGKLVIGAWFVFKEGKVTDYGAEQNKEALDQYFSLCPQASYLGELALVDTQSPIYQSQQIFQCILFDENASCHIALGNGYPIATPNGLNMTVDERTAIGVNNSLVHTDFMIGGPEVEVTAYDNEGNAIPIIRDGLFVI